MGSAKIVKLMSKHTGEMSLGTDCEQQTVCGGHEEPLPGAWAAPSFMQQVGPLRIGVTKCPFSNNKWDFQQMTVKHYTSKGCKLQNLTMNQ